MHARNRCEMVLVHVAPMLPHHLLLWVTKLPKHGPRQNTQRLSLCIKTALLAQPARL